MIILLQILAAASSAIMMFNVAVMYSVIIVVNGALTNTNNKDEIFTITVDEASWYGEYPFFLPDYVVEEW